MKRNKVVDQADQLLSMPGICKEIFEIQGKWDSYSLIEEYATVYYYFKSNLNIWTHDDDGSVPYRFCENSFLQ